MDTPEQMVITQTTDEDREALEILEHKERRDRFALAVLPEVFRRAKDDMALNDIADVCYAMADAMITRRQA